MKILLVSLFVILIMAGWMVFDTVKDAGEFKNIEPHVAGKVEKVPGVIGAEDITIHPQAGLAYLSCDDRRANLAGRETQGMIFVYDLKSENPELQNVTSNFEQEFHPHGISLFISPAGEERLFVVNHRRQGHFVEIFQIEGVGQQLVHLESIQDALMHSPNDLVAVGPRSFYVSNDHGSVSEFGRTLEEYLRLAKSNVLYFDGSKFTVAAENILYANGINVSHDGQTVYVAATTGGKIHVFDRNLSTGALEIRKTIDLGTGVDNIELDQEGNLWIAAHPKLLTFVDHAKDEKNLSPSQVLKISAASSENHLIDEVFWDAGETLSGSSVAALFDDTLLIGSVFDKHFLVLEMPSTTWK